MLTSSYAAWNGGRGTGIQDEKFVEAVHSTEIKARGSAWKTRVRSRLWAEFLPGYESSPLLNLNKLPLHDKLPLNYWIERVSLLCQRTRIIQEWGFRKIIGVESGLRLNLFFKDFNVIITSSRMTTKAVLGTRSTGGPNSNQVFSWLLPLSPSLPHCPLLEQEAAFTSKHLALVMRGRKWQVVIVLPKA